MSRVNDQSTGLAGYLSVTSACVLPCSGVYKMGSGFQLYVPTHMGGSVAEWLACWTQAQKGMGSNRSSDAAE